MRRSDAKFRAYAHRGGGNEAEENTRTAVAHTAALGYRYLETDLQVSRDGQIVLQHDRSLARTWGLDKNTDELTWAELSQLRSEGGCEMMRLVDVLAEFPQLHLNIDAKTDLVMPALLRLLQDPQVVERVTVASFSDRRLKQIRRGTKAATSLGTREVAGLVVASALGINPRHLGVAGVKQRVVAAQVPLRQYGVAVVTKRFIATAHRYGLEVHVWTINEREQMERLIDAGVDGLISDEPTLLAEVVKARGWSLQ